MDDGHCSENAAMGNAACELRGKSETADRPSLSQLSLFCARFFFSLHGLSFPIYFWFSLRKIHFGLFLSFCILIIFMSVKNAGKHFQRFFHNINPNHTSVTLISTYSKLSDWNSCYFSTQKFKTNSSDLLRHSFVLPNNIRLLARLWIVFISGDY